MPSSSTPRSEPALTYGRVFAISLPIILSNITTPLLGVTHTAVIGQLGSPHLIGAVTLGATVFTLLFWAFGFLRMGTTGLCAQADGARNDREVALTLARAVLLGLCAGVALVLLQLPILAIALHLLEASRAAEAEMQSYFAIRIWSAPAALANYAFLGWFIGLARTRIAFWLQLVLNGLNIILSIAFVSILGWGVTGVAAATVIAEFTAMALGIWIAWEEIRRRNASLSWEQIIDLDSLKHMLAVNGDLMIRTLCLLFAFTFFTAQAAKAGDITLAANAILLQFLNISAYLLDGFAFATEALTGRAIGSGERTRFRYAIKLASVWAIGISLMISLTFLGVGGWIIDFMTTDEQTRAMARIYLPWIIAAPISGVACFQLDGIFIGATRTRDMRNMMVLSLLIFLASWAWLTPLYGNHGLWASMIIFFIIRGLTLGAYYPSLEQASFKGAVIKLS